jgi:hypothetical protein
MQNVSQGSEQSEFDRIWALFQETREQIKENERILTEMFKETDAKFKETDARFKETDAKFKETRKMVGNLTNSWGAFVEGMVMPSVVQIFNERGIDIEEVFSRAKSRKKDKTMEIDIIGDNSSYVVAIEVKSKLLSYDVLQFVEKLGRFKYFFPKYANKDLIGAVAGITIDESVKNLALDKQLFIIMQKGEEMEIINDKAFKPKLW